MKLLVPLLLSLTLFSCKTDNHQKKWKSITINSKGSCLTAPDNASFYVTLSCLDKELEKSRLCLIEKSKTLQQTIKNLGVLKKDMKTTHIQMNKSYQWIKNTRTFIGFESSTRLNITIKDVSLIGRVYSEILKDENLTVSGLSFTHTKHDSLSNVAYLNALDKANKLVENLLTKIPENSKEIISISNNSSSDLNSYGDWDELAEDELAFAANEEVQEVSISPGEIIVSENLLIRYIIK